MSPAVMECLVVAVAKALTVRITEPVLDRRMAELVMPARIGLSSAAHVFVTCLHTVVMTLLASSLGGILTVVVVVAHRDIDLSSRRKRRSRLRMRQTGGTEAPQGAWNSENQKHSDISRSHESSLGISSQGCRPGAARHNLF